MAERPSRFHRRRKLTTGALLTLLVLSFTLFFSGARLHAQAVTGISGTVMDTSGAVIPGAQVTITDVSNGVRSKTVTSSAGTFTVVGLIPGNYSVVVEAKGFKSAQANLTVEVAKISTTSFKMTVGATTSTVQVKASALTLQTTSP